MNKIEEYYKEKIDGLLYLELKNSKYEIDYPLPILKKDFLEEINDDTFNENIEFKYFLRGMIYNIAVDPKFKYSNNYILFLKENLKEIDNIILDLALKEIDDDLETAAIFLKFGFENLNNTTINFYYATTLLELFKEREENYFIDEAKIVLNKNIALDEKYPLSYFKLGDIELYENNLIKANYYYQEVKKLLEGFPNRDLIERDIDNKIDSIKTEVLFEEIEILFQQSKFDKIIEILENIYEEDYRKYYYLGNVYFNLREYEKAFKNFTLADEYKEKDVEFYIDYGYFLSQVGYIDLALNTIEEGLEIYEDNESLLFNRAVIYLNIGEKEKAKEDLTNIVEYYDISEEIFNNSMILLEQIQNL